MMIVYIQQTMISTIYKNMYYLFINIYIFILYIF